MEKKSPLSFSDIFRLSSTARSEALQQPQLMGFRRASARAVDDKRKISEKLNGDFLSIFRYYITSCRIQRKLFETLRQNVVSTAHEQEMLERRFFFSNLFWSPPSFVWSIEFERASSSDIGRHTAQCWAHFFRLDERGTENNFLAIPFCFVRFLRTKMEGNSARSNEPNFGAGPASIFSPLPASVLDGRNRTGNQDTQTL